MRPIQTRFGLRAPRLEKALASLTAFWGEIIVPNGGGAANWLGLTTQNTVRSVYLTSGPNRILHFGAHQVELRHAPAWQLTAPQYSPGGLLAELGRLPVFGSIRLAMTWKCGCRVSSCATINASWPSSPSTPAVLRNGVLSRIVRLW